MERPRANIEPPVDEYDHELTPVQGNIIALADELLKHKEVNSRVTFADIMLEGEPMDMVAELKSGPLGGILSPSDKQLAHESDGSYYPVLDIRKESARLTGVGLRVFGWEDEMFRYIDPGQTAPPYDLKRYPGYMDKRREIKLSMGYKVGDQTFNEILTLSTSTFRPDDIRISSYVYLHAYMEHGYEGHGGRSDYNPSDEAVEWLLDFVARHVGDQPKSHFEYTMELLNKVRIKAEEVGAGEEVDRLIEATWPTQALFMLEKPCHTLEGMSIIEGLQTSDAAETAARAIKTLRQQWSKRKKGEQVDWIIDWRSDM